MSSTSQAFRSSKYNWANLGKVTDLISFSSMSIMDVGMRKEKKAKEKSQDSPELRIPSLQISFLTLEGSLFSVSPSSIGWTALDVPNPASSGSSYK